MSAFTIVQGDEKNIVVTVKGGVITGANNIQFVVQKGKASPESELELSLSGGEISNDSSTQFTITLVESNTLSLKPGNYEAQCLVTDANNKKKAVRFSPSSIEILQRLVFT